MSTVTSKLQVTIPKAVADQTGIRPGDTLEWVASGHSIRVLPLKLKQLFKTKGKDVAMKLKRFDEATRRQERREQTQKRVARRTKPRATPAGKRGWTREELYQRGHAGRH